jgi:hypothetical protein
MDAASDFSEFDDFGRMQMKLEKKLKKNDGRADR